MRTQVSQGEKPDNGRSLEGGGMTDATQEGIAALKSGQNVRARELLEQAVEENPDNLKAWLWLSGAVDTDQERLACLEQVLELNPDHAAAKHGVAALSRLKAARAALPESDVTAPEEVQGRAAPLAPPASEPPRPAEEVAGEVQPELKPVGPQEPEEPRPPEEALGEAMREPRSPEEAPQERAGEVGEPETGPEGKPQPEFEPEPKAPSGIIRFSVRPSLMPVVITALLWALLLAALYLVSRALLAESGIIVLLVTLVLGLVALAALVRLAARLLQLLFTRYAVTSEHLLVERGILTQKRQVIPLEDIQDVVARQTAIQRPLGIGDVVVETAGEQGTAELHDVARCQLYQEAILKAGQERAERLAAGA